MVQQKLIPGTGGKPVSSDPSDITDLARPVFFLACHASMVTAVTKLRSLHREYIICDEKKRFNA